MGEKLRQEIIRMLGEQERAANPPEKKLERRRQALLRHLDQEHSVSMPNGMTLEQLQEAHRTEHEKDDDETGY